MNARLHRVALGKGLDTPTMGGGASPYMKELCDKLAFIRAEPLAKFNMGDLVTEWYAPPTLAARYSTHAYAGWRRSFGT